MSELLEDPSSTQPARRRRVVPPTRAEDVLGLFADSKSARIAHQRWLADPGRAGVPEVVHGMRSSAVYIVTTTDIKRLDRKIYADYEDRRRSGQPFDLNESLHPLGNISYKAIHPGSHTSFKRIADWNPPAAFMHALYSYLEYREGELFTYPEFRRALRGATGFGPLLIPSAESLLKELASPSDVPLVKLHEAFHWRVGVAYYSFLRELYILAYFREHDLLLWTHPLADCLFRTDFWAQGPEGKKPFGVELYMSNDTYKSKKSGRKIPMRQFVNQVFSGNHAIELTDVPERGHLYVPTSSVLDGHLAEIRAKLSRLWGAGS